MPACIRPACMETRPRRKALAGRAHRSLIRGGNGAFPRPPLSRGQAFAHPTAGLLRKSRSPAEKASLDPFCCHGMDMEAVNHLRRCGKIGDGFGALTVRLIAAA